MNFFSKLFSSENESKEPHPQLPWKSLASAFQLDEIVKLSKTQTVLLFKHSTRCHISKMVLSRFEEQLDFNQEQMELYFLDLLNFRELSDEISTRFQVMHQSPQLLVIKNGVCVAHGSHYEILEMEIR